MKKIIILAFVVFTVNAFSQVPQQMNYQAVVRNSQGNIVSNQHVSLRFTIYNGSPTGQVVYQEVQSDTTNQFGLVTTSIGKNGNLSSVSWSSGAKYLEVDIDPIGGTNYIDMGTSQLFSVPYALYAETANAAGVTGATGLRGNTGATG